MTGNSRCVKVKPRIRAFIADHPGTDDRDAMRAVLRDNPGLQRRYLADVPTAPIVEPDTGVDVGGRIVPLTREFIARIEAAGGTIDYNTTLHRLSRSHGS